MEFAQELGWCDDDEPFVLVSCAAVFEGVGQFSGESGGFLCLGGGGFGEGVVPGAAFLIVATALGGQGVVFGATFRVVKLTYYLQVAKTLDVLIELGGAGVGDKDPGGMHRLTPHGLVWWVYRA